MRVPLRSVFLTCKPPAIRVVSRVRTCAETLLNLAKIQSVCAQIYRSSKHCPPFPRKKSFEVWCVSPSPHAPFERCPNAHFTQLVSPLTPSLASQAGTPEYPRFFLCPPFLSDHTLVCTGCFLWTFISTSTRMNCKPKP